jgi:mono/diheme cytochrome c family protein
MRRSLLISLSAFVLLASTSLASSAQTLVYTRKPDAKNGKTIYQGGCIACHGADGRGADEKLTEFKRPGTWPDFTRCDQTTPEPDSAWKAVIVNGGPYLGFSTIMPRFKDLLANDQIDDVVAYLRTFCTSSHWPRGELNLPRAIVTEKAFPEDEVVWSTGVNASGAPGFETHVIHEQAFGSKGQVEVDVPWQFQNQNHAWDNHIGDITLGWKQVMYSNLRSGSIFALQGGILPPTGSTKLGGAGTTTFEPFAAFDQLFKSNTWVQFQMGADLPVDTKKSPQSLFWYTALGQTIAGDHRLGRQWSPTVEFLATRDLVDGAKTDWDIMPEMQVTASKRQHFRVNLGVRAPVTDTAGRSPQVYFYVLWDWAEGHFWNGW